MTEIKIEKKKPVWPWVLAGIVVIAVVGYFLMSDNTGQRDETDYATQTENGIMEGTRDQTNTYQAQSRDGKNPAVASYISFVKSDMDRSDLNHETVSEAFNRLAEATNAIASEVGYTQTQNIDVAREQINMITNDPYETSHANSIRKTADVLSDELQKIQQSNFPNLDNKASDLKEATSSIKPEELALDQNDEIKSFLSQAAELLEDMDDDMD